MDGLAVAAALMSALLHASWNAAVKSSADPDAAMAAQVVTSGLLSLPLLLLLPWPPAQAVPFILGSTACNLVALVAMVRGYRLGGFGLVYPLTRATSPLMVAILAFAAVGERIGPYGIAGIALVSSGIALFSLGQGRTRAPALGYALLAGSASALYTVFDAQAVRLSPSVLGYGMAMSAVNAVTFGGLYAARRGGLVAGLGRALAGQARIALPGSLAAITSYMLILWVYLQAPIAVASALRDTSIVFGALIAVVVLGERMTGPRIAAIACVALGSALLRFA